MEVNQLVMDIYHLRLRYPDTIQSGEELISSSVN